MARITADKAVDAIGNRYDLILVASHRVRELHNGHHALVKSDHNSVVTALKEVEAGLVGREYLYKRPVSDKRKK